MAERELLTILLGLGILAYFCIEYRRQATLGELVLPLLGFFFILLGWVVNAFDGEDPNWMRVAEHALYTIGAVIFVCWTRKLQRGESKWIR